MTTPTTYGSKVLLMGESGCGKTYAPAFLALDGYNVRYLLTENSQTTFKTLPKDVRACLGKNLHYHYCPTTTTALAAITEMGKTIQRLSYQGLSEQKSPNKKNERDYLAILETLANFTSDQTGESFGSVEDWGEQEVLVFDSLSGLNLAARALAIGRKPTAQMGEWGVMMHAEEEVVKFLCLNLTCHVIVTAHLDRQRDEVAGTQKIFPDLLGTKLAPKIPRYFDEVIRALRTKDGYFWETASDKTVTKTRLLPASDQLAPNFRHLFSKWALLSAEEL
ncbi:MAG: AAA family ATPase [Deltaproteobacteria bacterium]|nr:AAA family ATPase [Deltaproteobacteria bacterium]